MSEVVHEIRNQLTVAIANVEAFIDGKLQPTPARLMGVVSALRAVDALIDGVPEMAVEAHAESIVNVCTLIERETSSMEATALARDITLSFDRCAQTHASCAFFRCDPGAVRQMLKNLLINAVRYTPRGGAIHVDCHREPGVLAFTVRDDGPGVRLEERDAIFARGARGSAAGASAGSGLGLAACGKSSSGTAAMSMSMKRRAAVRYSRSICLGKRSRGTRRELASSAERTPCRSRHNFGCRSTVISL